MAAFNKFLNFVETLGTAENQLNTNTLKVMLVNSPAPVNTNTVKADLTEIAAGGGYTAGGEDTLNTYSEAAGVGSCIGTDIVWTGSGGGFGPFRYAVLYDDTSTTPDDQLIGWWDYGSSISILAAETFTLDFGTSMFTIT